MDLFERKTIKPMLIGAESDAFNSSDYIYELKFDGVRCIAYLDKDVMELQNKRSIRVSAIYPELANINKQIKQKCILDGELVVMREGKPDFFGIQRRALMSDKTKIALFSSTLPVSFVAYDILYYKDKQITDLPLIERKKILSNNVKENEKISVSRFIEEKGIMLYNMAVEQELEGTVAKLKSSKYYFDKRTKDWIKIKYMKDEDYVICGYISKDKNMTSLVLGQYNAKNELVYKGHVTLGVSGHNLQMIKRLKRAKNPFADLPSGNENANWVEPILVGIVEYMPRGESKCQPVFKGIRDDKEPFECREIL